MKYTFEQVIKSIPAEKRKMDSQVTFLFIRPFSFFITYFVVNLGISAWFVSLVSAITVFTGCMLVCIDSNVTTWIGIVLIILWAVLDCVDGNTARVTKTQSNKGAFMDAESGYFTCAFLYFSYGMAAFHTSDGRIVSNLVMLVFFGAFASLSDILSRLIYQKYVSVAENSNNNAGSTPQPSPINKIRKRISTELGITGLAPIGGIIAQAFVCYDFLVLFYFFFCSMTLLFTSVYYSLKAHQS